MALLSDVIDINPQSITRQYSHDTIEYIDISSVHSGSYDGTKTLKLKDAPSRAKRIVADGDTILATVRPNLRAFMYIKNPVDNTVASTGFAVLRAKSNRLNSRYLYYVITDQRFTDYLTLNAKGSAYPAVDAGIIGRAEIKLPTPAKQEKIAKILGAYDDAIENISKRIEKLETMARLIYKTMFENRLSEGDVMPFIDCIEINPKVTVPKDGAKPYISMDSLRLNSMIIESVDWRSGNSGAKFAPGDTLFARITPSLENGKTSYVFDLPNNEEVGFGSTEFIVMRSKSLSPELAYLVARSDIVRETAIKSMTGASGRQRVQDKCFEEITLPRLSDTDIKELSKKLRPIFMQVNILHKKSQKLARARDLLLPRLMSGEIVV